VSQARARPPRSDLGDAQRTPNHATAIAIAVTATDLIFLCHVSAAKPPKIQPIP
jgi:hypothetical protein